MESFKVICKAPADNWQQGTRTKVVTTNHLFGLIRTSKVVSEPNRVPGPGKDEICIVIEVRVFDNGKFYWLAGYPHGYYDSRCFIRLEEFTETQKEIAEKVEFTHN